MKVDFLIVGQGLAGTLLAHFLEQNGASIAIVNNRKSAIATQVAAGLINPITGRRYVKSWKVDELIPFAQQTYAEIGKLLHTNYYNSQPIIRTLNSIKEENDWWGRSAIPSYQKYMANEAQLGNYAQFTTPVHAYSQTNGGAQVNIGDMTNDYATYWLGKGCLFEEEFDYEQLSVIDNGVEYKDIHAKQVVFCEGANGSDNRWFAYLPFNLSKGEVIVVRIPNANFDRIFKHKLFIIPKGDDLYWIGSVYDWNFKDEQPTPQTKQTLIEKLDAVLTIPFEVVAHQAAVRPTVKDRRPFLGQHPQEKHLFIFNGLGTKGTSLGPFWAHAMAQYLLEGKALDEEVNINRFGV